MAKKSYTMPKRNIATFSLKEREEGRAKVIKEAVSSKKAATEFLQRAGILNKEGQLSKQYR